MDTRITRFFLLNFAAGSALYVFLWPVFLAYPEISLENGLLENVQAVFLGVELLLLCISSPWWLGREDAWIGLFLVAGLLTMLLRELDLERLPLPSLLVTLGSGFGRNLLWALLWTTVLATAVKKRARLSGWLRQGLSSPWGWSLLLGGSGYLAADLFDHEILPLAKTTLLFCEEALETLGVFWLGMGIVRWAVGSRISNRNNQEVTPQ